MNNGDGRRRTRIAANSRVGKGKLHAGGFAKTVCLAFQSAHMHYRRGSPADLRRQLPNRGESGQHGAVMELPKGKGRKKKDEACSLLLSEASESKSAEKESKAASSEKDGKTSAENIR